MVLESMRSEQDAKGFCLMTIEGLEFLHGVVTLSLVGALP